MCNPWIEPLLGHKFINPKDFKSKQGFFLRLFKEKKPEGKFVLSPITKTWRVTLV
jgi:dTDP-4-dehydrorhamnose 3,5-epimerase-like enzyme